MDYFPLTAVHYNHWNADIQLFRKVGTLGPGVYKISADTRMPLTQEYLPPLLDSTAGLYNSTCTSLWLVYVHQGTALEHMQLDSTRTHFHAYQKYREIQTPPHFKHAAVSVQFLMRFPSGSMWLAIKLLIPAFGAGNSQLLGDQFFLALPFQQWSI